jgi:hypothetical protein
MQMGRRPHQHAHVRCCEEADLASLGWICFAEQRCTYAALVLDACTRVPAAGRKRPHRSALCIRRRRCRWVADRINVLMFGVAKKLTSCEPRVDLFR